MEEVDVEFGRRRAPDLPDRRRLERRPRRARRARRRAPGVREGAVGGADRAGRAARPRRRRAGAAQAYLHAILDLILRHTDEGGAIYGQGDRLDTGDRLVMRDLADSLDLIAEQGARALYGGELARRLVEHVRADGGGSRRRSAKVPRGSAAARLRAVRRPRVPLEPAAVVGRAADRLRARPARPAAEAARGERRRDGRDRRGDARAGAGAEPLRAAALYRGGLRERLLARGDPPGCARCTATGPVAGAARRAGHDAHLGRRPRATPRR